METEKKKNIQFNPLDITESLGYTTFRRDARKGWTKEEDQKLTELVDAKLRVLGYADGIQTLTRPEYATQSSKITQDINWDELSELLQTRKPKDCRKRWTNSLDPNLKKGKWTPEEDELLIATFKKHGSSWQKISLEIPGRTDDQCAKRYIEVLDPNTRDRLRTWSLAEDLSLIKKVKTYGTKWRTISMEMESRPSLTCRNRWRKIVTDVVRGKAHAEIKKEIDSIEGGFSKLEEISEILQVTKKDKESKKENKKEKKSKKAKSEEPQQDAHLGQAQKTLVQDNTSKPEAKLDTVPQLTQPLLSQQPQQQQQPQLPSALNSSLPPSSSSFVNHLGPQISNGQAQHAVPINKHSQQHIHTPLTGIGSPSYAGHESPRPTSTEMDWKYTLKDTSGLTVSNGSISTSELAKNLIENAKKYNLKISIHQHIHHHYAQNSTSKTGSPEDSASNASGAYNNDQDMIHPNRLSHFNYLPPMAQPQLESSSFDNDRTNLLNPTNNHHYQTTSSKRRLSNSSNNSRKKIAGHQHYQQSYQQHSNNPLEHEDLEDELDFWETMRSLSQVVNGEPVGSSRVHAKPHHPNHNNNNNNRAKHPNNKKANAVDGEVTGLYYEGFTGEEDLDFEELEDNLKDLGGFANGLPFNPS